LFADGYLAAGISRGVKMPFGTRGLRGETAASLGGGVNAAEEKARSIARQVAQLYAERAGQDYRRINRSVLASVKEGNPGLVRDFFLTDGDGWYLELRIGDMSHYFRILPDGEYETVTPEVFLSGQILVSDNSQFEVFDSTLQYGGGQALWDWENYEDLERNKRIRTIQGRQREIESKMFAMVEGKGSLTQEALDAFQPYAEEYLALGKELEQSGGTAAPALAAVSPHNTAALEQYAPLFIRAREIAFGIIDGLIGRSDDPAFVAQLREIKERWEWYSVFIDGGVFKRLSRTLLGLHEKEIMIDEKLWGKILASEKSDQILAELIARAILKGIEREESDLNFELESALTGGTLRRLESEVRAEPELGVKTPTHDLDRLFGKLTGEERQVMTFIMHEDPSALFAPPAEIKRQDWRLFFDSLNQIVQINGQYRFKGLEGVFEGMAAEISLRIPSAAVREKYEKAIRDLRERLLFAADYVLAHFDRLSPDDFSDEQWLWLSRLDVRIRDKILRSDRFAGRAIIQRLVLDALNKLREAGAIEHLNDIPALCDDGKFLPLELEAVADACRSLSREGIWHKPDLYAGDFFAAASRANIHLKYPDAYMEEGEVDEEALARIRSEAMKYLMSGIAGLPKTLLWKLPGAVEIEISFKPIPEEYRGKVTPQLAIAHYTPGRGQGGIRLTMIGYPSGEQLRDVITALIHEIGHKLSMTQSREGEDLLPVGDFQELSRLSGFGTYFTFGWREASAHSISEIRSLRDWEGLGYLNYVWHGPDGRLISYIPQSVIDGRPANVEMLRSQGVEIIADSREYHIRAAPLEVIAIAGSESAEGFLERHGDEVSVGLRNQALEILQKNLLRSPYPVAERADGSKIHEIYFPEGERGLITKFVDEAGRQFEDLTEAVRALPVSAASLGDEQTLRKYAARLAESNGPVTVEQLRRVNELACGEGSLNGGILRRSAAYVRDDLGFIAKQFPAIEPDELTRRLAEILDWFNDPVRENEDPIEVAARAAYELFNLHPFVDGNKRTSTVLMNIALQRRGLPDYRYDPLSMEETPFLAANNVERFVSLIRANIEASLAGHSLGDDRNIFERIADAMDALGERPIRRRTIVKGGVFGGILGALSLAGLAGCGKPSAPAPARPAEPAAPPAAVEPKEIEPPAVPAAIVPGKVAAHLDELAKAMDAGSIQGVAGLNSAEYWIRIAGMPESDAVAASKIYVKHHNRVLAELRGKLEGGATVKGSDVLRKIAASIRKEQGTAAQDMGQGFIEVKGVRFKILGKQTFYSSDKNQQIEVLIVEPEGGRKINVFGFFDPSLNKILIVESEIAGFVDSVVMPAVSGKDSRSIPLWDKWAGPNVAAMRGAAADMIRKAFGGLSRQGVIEAMRNSVIRHEGEHAFNDEKAFDTLKMRGKIKEIIAQFGQAPDPEETAEAAIQIEDELDSRLVDLSGAYPQAALVQMFDFFQNPVVNSATYITLAIIFEELSGGRINLYRGINPDIQLPQLRKFLEACAAKDPAVLKKELNDAAVRIRAKYRLPKQLVFLQDRLRQIQGADTRYAVMTDFRMKGPAFSVETLMARLGPVANPLHHDAGAMIVRAPEGVMAASLGKIPEVRGPPVQMKAPSLKIALTHPAFRTAILLMILSGIVWLPAVLGASALVLPAKYLMWSAFAAASLSILTNLFYLLIRSGVFVPAKNTRGRELPLIERFQNRLRDFGVTVPPYVQVSETVHAKYLCGFDREGTFWIRPNVLRSNDLILGFVVCHEVFEMGLSKKIRSRFLREGITNLFSFLYLGFSLLWAFAAFLARLPFAAKAILGTTLSSLIYAYVQMNNEQMLIQFHEHLARAFTTLKTPEPLITSGVIGLLALAINAFPRFFFRASFRKEQKREWLNRFPFGNRILFALGTFGALRLIPAVKAWHMGGYINDWLLMAVAVLGIGSMIGVFTELLTRIRILPERWRERVAMPLTWLIVLYPLWNWGLRAEFFQLFGPNYMGVFDFADLFAIFGGFYFAWKLFALNRIGFYQFNFRRRAEEIARAMRGSPEKRQEQIMDREMRYLVGHLDLTEGKDFERDILTSEFILAYAIFVHGLATRIRPEEADQVFREVSKRVSEVRRNLFGRPGKISVLKLFRPFWPRGVSGKFSVLGVNLKFEEARPSRGANEPPLGCLEYALTKKSLFQRFGLWLNGKTPKTDGFVRVFFKMDRDARIAGLDGAEIEIGGEKTTIPAYRLDAHIRIAPARGRARKGIPAEEISPARRTPPRGASLGMEPDELIRRAEAITAIEHPRERESFAEVVLSFARANGVNSDLEKALLRALENMRQEDMKFYDEIQIFVKALGFCGSAASFEGLEGLVTGTDVWMFQQTAMDSIARIGSREVLKDPQGIKGLLSRILAEKTGGEIMLKAFIAIVNLVGRDFVEELEAMLPETEDKMKRFVITSALKWIREPRAEREDAFTEFYSGVLEATGSAIPKIADIGAGYGEFERKARSTTAWGRNAEFVSTDSDEGKKILAMGLNFVDLLKMNWDALEFEGGEFDLVTLNYPSPNVGLDAVRKALTESFRVCKPGGGIAFLSVDEAENGFAPGKITAILKEAGFEPDSVRIFAGSQIPLSYPETDSSGQVKDAGKKYLIVARKPEEVSQIKGLSLGDEDGVLPGEAPEGLPGAEPLRIISEEGIPVASFSEGVSGPRAPPMFDLQYYFGFLIPLSLLHLAFLESAVADTVELVSQGRMQRFLAEVAQGLRLSGVSEEAIAVLPDFIERIITPDYLRSILEIFGRMRTASVNLGRLFEVTDEAKMKAWREIGLPVTLPGMRVAEIGFLHPVIEEILFREFLPKVLAFMYRTDEARVREALDGIFAELHLSNAIKRFSASALSFAGVSFPEFWEEKGRDNYINFSRRMNRLAGGSIFTAIAAHVFNNLVVYDRMSWVGSADSADSRREEMEKIVTRALDNALAPDQSETGIVEILPDGTVLVDGQSLGKGVEMPERDGEKGGAPSVQEKVKREKAITPAGFAAIGFWLWAFVNQVSQLYPFRILHEHIHVWWSGYGKILVNPHLLSGKILAWVSPFVDVAKPSEWDEGANVLARFQTHGGNAFSNWAAEHPFLTQMGPLVPNAVDLWIGLGLLWLSKRVTRDWLKTILKGMGLAQLLIVGTYLVFDVIAALLGNYVSPGDFGESARSFLGLGEGEPFSAAWVVLTGAFTIALGMLPLSFGKITRGTAGLFKRVFRRNERVLIPARSSWEKIRGGTLIAFPLLLIIAFVAIVPAGKVSLMRFRQNETLIGMYESDPNDEVRQAAITELAGRPDLTEDELAKLRRTLKSRFRSPETKTYTFESLMDMAGQPRLAGFAAKTALEMYSDAAGSGKDQLCRVLIKTKEPGAMQAVVRDLGRAELRSRFVGNVRDSGIGQFDFKAQAKLRGSYVQALIGLAGQIGDGEDLSRDLDAAMTYHWVKSELSRLGDSRGYIRYKDHGKSVRVRVRSLLPKNLKFPESFVDGEPPKMPRRPMMMSATSEMAGTAASRTLPAPDTVRTLPESSVTGQSLGRLTEAWGNIQKLFSGGREEGREKKPRREYPAGFFDGTIFDAPFIEYERSRSAEHRTVVFDLDETLGFFDEEQGKYVLKEGTTSGALERQLAELRDSGVRLVLWTAAKRAAVEVLFEGHPWLAQYFDRVITRENFYRIEDYEKKLRKAYPVSEEDFWKKVWGFYQDRPSAKDLGLLGYTLIVDDNFQIGRQEMPNAPSRLLDPVREYKYYEPIALNLFLSPSDEYLSAIAEETDRLAGIVLAQLEDGAPSIMKYQDFKDRVEGASLGREEIERSRRFRDYLTNPNKTRLSRKDKEYFFQRLIASAKEYAQSGRWVYGDSRNEFTEDEFMYLGESLSEVLSHRHYFSSGAFRDLLRELTGDWDLMDRLLDTSLFMEHATDGTKHIVEEFESGGIRSRELKLPWWDRFVLAVGSRLNSTTVFLLCTGIATLLVKAVLPYIEQFIRGNLTLSGIAFTVIVFSIYELMKLQIRRVLDPQINRLNITTTHAQFLHRRQLYTWLMESEPAKLKGEISRARHEFRRLREQLRPHLKPEDGLSVPAQLKLLRSASEMVIDAFGLRRWNPMQGAGSPRKFEWVLHCVEEMIRLESDGVSAEAIALAMVKAVVNARNIPDWVIKKWKNQMHWAFGKNAQLATLRLHDLIDSAARLARGRFRVQAIRREESPEESMHPLQENPDVARQLARQLTHSEKKRYQAHYLQFLADQIRGLANTDQPAPLVSTGRIRGMIQAYFYRDYFRVRDLSENMPAPGRVPVIQTKHAARAFRAVRFWEAFFESLRKIDEEELNRHYGITHQDLDRWIYISREARAEVAREIFAAGHGLRSRDLSPDNRKMIDAVINAVEGEIQRTAVTNLIDADRIEEKILLSVGELEELALMFERTGDFELARQKIAEKISLAKSWRESGSISAEDMAQELDKVLILLDEMMLENGQALDPKDLL
ncbi:MAG TPA: Fic family protein, partial [Candidatus Omnitrophota bacterium]|nr:Fic family protein [Candidatus Omnitrophota bacterium]